jgi:hypothetical protein
MAPSALGRHELEAVDLHEWRSSGVAIRARDRSQLAFLARTDSQEIARLDAAESVFAHEHLRRIPQAPLN